MILIFGYKKKQEEEKAEHVSLREEISTRDSCLLLRSKTSLTEGNEIKLNLTLDPISQIRKVTC